MQGRWLWFDVEEGYNTTALCETECLYQLWFDVEEGYNTTGYDGIADLSSCGLM